MAQENQAGYEALAKFWLRIAESYVALKNYEEAIKAYNKSLLEQTTDKARQGLKKVCCLSHSLSLPRLLGTCAHFW